MHLSPNITPVFSLQAGSSCSSAAQGCCTTLSLCFLVSRTDNPPSPRLLRPPAVHANALFLRALWNIPTLHWQHTNKTTLFLSFVTSHPPPPHARPSAQRFAPATAPKMARRQQEEATVAPTGADHRSRPAAASSSRKRDESSRTTKTTTTTTTPPLPSRGRRLRPRFGEVALEAAAAEQSPAG